MKLPKIGITMGDPTGIGPEIIVKALSRRKLFQVCRPIVFGDREVLSRAVQIQNLAVSLEIIKEVPEEGYLPGKIFLFSPTRLKVSSLRFGKPDRACGRAMVKYIEEAVQKIQSGALDALTTCPINKQAMNRAGYPFPGHTELLAHLTGATQVAMMFLGSTWKIVLATTHLPLKEVSKRITSNHLLSILQLTHDGMRKYFGISHPKMAVLGLNPHCGEEGLLGEEERKEILPAILKAKAYGMDVEGPFPADSFFNISKVHGFDVVVSMYHDQGLIPIKTIEFKKAVNFTLGLPFIRTSVDHGTAYEMAGKGLADPANLFQAILTAANLLKFKRY